MNAKPTIFFSHSSKDALALKRLKEIFVRKTHGTIDVFLSSDGQSIRLGRNWVHEIQEALERASFMAVFLTPNSITSGWIHFESGYCHSRSVEVVPIGFGGVDLDSVRPPLSLLEGFNLSGAPSLNNLIAMVNQKFSFSHPESFTEAEFEEILDLTRGVDAPNKLLFELIESSKIEIESTNLEEEPITVAKHFSDVLHQLDGDARPSVHGDHVRFFGGTAEFGLRRKSKVGGQGERIGFAITSRFYISDFIRIGIALRKIAEEVGITKAEITIDIKDSFELVASASEVSSRLRGTEINLSENELSNAYIFRNLHVILGSQAIYISIYKAEQIDCFQDLLALVELLVSQGVIREC